MPFGRCCKTTPVQTPIAVVGSVYTLHWAGAGPIAPLIERYGIKVGDGLYCARQVQQLLADERRMFTEILRRRGKSVLPQALMEARIRADERRKTLEFAAASIDEIDDGAAPEYRACQEHIRSKINRKEPTK
ncbi:hypothetical protein BAU06_09165 [Bordetella bronchialis]|uniref:Uncharacterized protein n=2 Tax=Bordetella bronchialis TaxID=463025 RepID=A0ABN4R1Y2_9BORD|nr:hypothetical protein BAU06_09165 [Bordetella bronchialis]